jgi:AraC-like DNA-binding protein
MGKIAVSTTYVDHLGDGHADGMVRSYTIAPLPRHRGHAHTDLEWNLVIAGTGGYDLPDRRYRFGPDTLVFLLPGQHHALARTRPGLRLWVVALRGAVLRRHLTTRRFAPLHAAHPPGHLVRRIAPEQARALAGLLADLERCQDDPVRFNTGLVYATAWAWSLFLEADAAAPGLHPAVAQARTALAEDPSLPLAVLAARAGLSQARLARAVRHAYGIGLSSLRSHMRLELALAAASGPRHLAQAARAAGFGSYRQFHRVCRTRLGVGPRAALASRTFAVGLGSA